MVCKELGHDPAQWQMEFRGLKVKNWATLGSIEGSDGGRFKLVFKPE